MIKQYNPAFTFYTPSKYHTEEQKVYRDNPFGEPYDMSDLALGFNRNNDTIIYKPNTPETVDYVKYLNEMANQDQLVQEIEQPKTYTTKQDLKGNKKRAMEFFQSKGLNAHQAAGIVGNLIVESALNTTIKGDGGKAFGLAQWHPDRQKGLKALAQKRGTDISDFDTQLEYVWEELNSPGYKLALNGILNSRNAKEATTAFMKHFEKPGIPHFEKRLKEAETLLS